MADEKKKSGRKPLPPEIKALHLAKKRAKDQERHRASGWAASKRYRERNKEALLEKQRQKRRGKYKPEILLPQASKELLAQLSKQNGLTVTELFAFAIKEQFGINILDNNDI